MKIQKKNSKDEKTINQSEYKRQIKDIQKTLRQKKQGKRKKTKNEKT